VKPRSEIPARCGTLIVISPSRGLLERIWDVSLSCRIKRMAGVCLRLSVLLRATLSPTLSPAGRGAIFFRGFDRDSSLDLNRLLPGAFCTMLLADRAPT